MLGRCTRALLILGDFSKTAPIHVRGLSVAQPNYIHTTDAALKKGHEKHRKHYYDVRHPNYHDDFPAMRGGPTQRTHMLDNIKLQAKVDELNGYLGIKPAEAQMIVHQSKHPRHMELLGFNKPQGFNSLKNSRSFFNKLNLIRTQKETTAWVENFSGDIIASASTHEYAIAKQLYSVTDVMAAVNIARVLAMRCNQVGVRCVQWSHTKGIGYKKFHHNAETTREFEGMMYKGGVKLSEPPLKRLKGPPPVIPEAPDRRTYPGKMTRGERKRYTWKRFDKPKQIFLFVPGVSDRAPFYAEGKQDHDYPEL